MIRHRMAIQRQMAQEAEQQKPKAESDDTGPAGLELMPEISPPKRKAAKPKPAKARPTAQPKHKK